MLASHQRFHRIDAFRACGAGWWILQKRDDPSKIRYVSDFCHDRWCVPCARARAARIRANLLPRLKERRLSFLTLTLRSSSSPLAHQIDRLLKCYRRLRSRVLWRERVTGSLAVFELTWSDRRQQWHPHLHVVAEAAFMPQRELSRVWLQVTGDSPIVDIREARSVNKVAEYITKYITKPIGTAVTRHYHQLAEAVEALRGRKLLIQTGTWVRWKLTAPPGDSEWTLLAHSAQVPLGTGIPPHILAHARAHLASLDRRLVTYEFDLPPPAESQDTA